MAVTNIGIGIVSFVIGVVLARSLTEADRGTFALAILWPTIGQILFAVGIRVATVYYVAGSAFDRRRVVANAFGGVLVSSLLLVAVGTAILFGVGVPSEYRTPLLIVLLATPISMLGGVASGVAQAAENIRLWSRLRVVQPVTYLGLAVAFGATGRLTAVTAATAYVGSLFVQWVLFHYFGVVRPGLSGWALEREVLAALYRYGLWNMLSSALETINLRLDLLILGLMVPARDVGQYAIAVGMSLTMLPFAGVAAPWILPTLVRTKAEHRKPRAIFAISLTALISGVGNLIGIIFAPAIVEFVVGARWLPAVPAFRLLLVGSFFLSIREVLTSIANGYGRPYAGAVADGASAFMTVLIIVPAIRLYGIEGAAAASTVAYGTSVALLILIARNHLGWRRRRESPSVAISAAQEGEPLPSTAK